MTRDTIIAPRAKSSTPVSGRWMTCVAYLRVNTSVDNHPCFVSMASCGTATGARNASARSRGVWVFSLTSQLRRIAFPMSSHRICGGSRRSDIVAFYSHNNKASPFGTTRGCGQSATRAPWQGKHTTKARRVQPGGPFSLRP